MLKRFKIFPIVFGLVVLGATFAVPALAQEYGPAIDQTAFQLFAEQAGFGGAADIRLIIARLIRTVLSFVGVVLLGYLVYGGVLWMTSRGEAEKVTKAKKTLVNAIIGTVIILSSWAITSFIVNRLVESVTGVVGEGEENGPYDTCPPYCDDPYYDDLITESFGCSVGALDNMNVVVTVLFNQDVEESTVESNFKVYENGVDEVEGTYEVDDDYVSFTPSAPCPGAPTEYCFEPNMPYTVVLGSGLESVDGDRIECDLGEGCESEFSTGELIDVADPEAVMTDPDDNEDIGVGIPQGLQAQAIDDGGINRVSFYVNGSFEDGGVELDPDVYVGLWGDPELGDHELYARAYDCAGNRGTSETINVDVVELHCVDGEMNEDEEDVDCGGEDCGACPGEVCEEDDECESGFCEDGICVGYPAIDSVSPTFGTTGNFISIEGEYFGDDTGTIYFLGADTDEDGEVEGDDDDQVAPLSSCEEPWSDTLVLIEVPENAVGGPIKLLTAPTEDAPEGMSDRTDDLVRGTLISDFVIDEVVRPGLCPLLPDEALPADTVQAPGKNFGQDVAALYLTDAPNSYEPSVYFQRESTMIEFRVPPLSAGDYSVQVFVDSEPSNIVSFTAMAETEEEAPIINYVDSGRLACSDSVEASLSCVEDNDCVNVCNQLIGYCENDGSVVCDGNEDCNFGTCDEAGDTGPIGQYVTIFGSDFGDDPGVVYFRHDQDQLPANMVFPEICEDNNWTDTAITVKVPDEAVVDDPHHIWVYRTEDQAESNEAEFNVLDGLPGSSVCAISPESGPIDSPVVLFGENFGNVTGTVKFWEELLVTPDIWGYDQVDATVPEGATTGRVYVYADGVQSNPVNFTVANCNEDEDVCAQDAYCCEDGTCDDSEPYCSEPEVSAEYTWRFSTGPIPDAPEVITECTQVPDQVISPTPYSLWEGGEDACVNSRVQVSFEDAVEVWMDSINAETVLVQQCVDNTCDEDELNDPLAGVFDVTVQNSFFFDASELYEVDSWYQVTLLGAANDNYIQSLEFVPLARDYIWSFKTRAEIEECEIEDAYVVPPSLVTLTEVGEMAKFAASPVGPYECQLLIGNDNDWLWEAFYGGNFGIDTLIDFLPNLPQVYNAKVRALAETEDDHNILVRASILEEGVSDEGELKIDFDEPSLTDWRPDCDEACIDADIGATFNVRLDPLSIIDTNFYLYQCADSECEVGLDQITVSPLLVYGVDYDEVSLVFNGNLDPGMYYRVIIKGDDPLTLDVIDGVKSRSGVGLYISGELQYGNDASWIFKTKDEVTPCGIESVTMTPERAIMNYVGEQKIYQAIPYGAPDECEPSGQRLSAYDIPWTWAINDVEGWNIADFNPVDLDINQTLPDGCSSSCLHTGSEAGVPVCGNDELETIDLGFQYNEDCDDGNLLSGDGCSSECLNEGSTAVGATCNDGAITYDPTQGGEECEDGNTDDGDGCSSECLNEGSELAETDCGDRFVNQDPLTKVGEECDDGNDQSGDGCSAVCLNEGSQNATEVSAVCGNGSVEDGEDCDDGGAVAGDGCSAVCLNEGSIAIGATCGDGTVEHDPAQGGEECEDGNTNDGDGCSSECLLEGSSYLYDNPSFCGDTILEDVSGGEECEASESDGMVDPWQIVEIAVEAPEAVSELDQNPIETDLTATGEDAYQEEETGVASVGLLCACDTDLSCGADVQNFGCGKSGCCFERPEVTYFEPNGESSICRNTALTIQFNQLMERTSLQDNIVLAYLGEGTLPDQPPVNPLTECPDGYSQYPSLPTAMNDGPWYARAWDWVKTRVMKVFGRDALANDIEACILNGALSIEDIEDEGTLVNYKFSQALESQGLYRLVVATDVDANDDNNDATYNVGVLNQGSVSMVEGSGELYGFDNATYSSFVTGSDICSLDLVVVEDLDEESPGLFTEAGEVHEIAATPLTVQGVFTYEIQALPGAYEWEWFWYTSVDDADDENVLSLDALYDPAVSQESVDLVTNSPTAISGEEHVIAEANITTDIYFDTVGDTTDGELEETVFLCENPWPAVGHFPFEDTEEGDLDFEEAVVEGPEMGYELGVDFGPSVRQDLGGSFPYSNFSFYYCRDAGLQNDTSDDLPGLSVVEVPSPPTENIFRELLFIVQGEDYADAIGVRLATNEEYLSPEDWYADQGFSGTASSESLDGYEGVRDGRTVYVSAANQTGNIYPNIYAIAYNENANDETEEIYEEILDNWSFNANSQIIDDKEVDVIKSVALCYETDGNGLSGLLMAEDSTVSCESDADCKIYDDEAVCADYKAKLQRDLKRLSDFRTMINALEDYGSSNQHCSVTKGESCYSDANCPDGEECVPTVPELSTGTFLRSRSFSAWPSWQSQLANVLGEALPVDPLNNLFDCPEEYDQESCWNSATSEFVCQEDSHLYAYRSIGGEEYALYGDLEYNAAPWAYELDDDPDTYPIISLGNAESEWYGFDPDWNCNGTVLGISSQCGDGVIGDGEICEVGDSDTVDCEAGDVFICFNDDEPSYDGDVCDPNDPDFDIADQCGDFGTCQNGYRDNGSGCYYQPGDQYCHPVEGVKSVTCCDENEATCGNIEAACDRYQTPDESPSACSPYTCGNGVVDGVNEYCDDGAFNGVYGYCGEDCNFAGAIYCGDGSLAGGEVCDCGYDNDHRPQSCVTWNGLYSQDPSDGCAYDCSGSPPHCGDAIANGDEECDTEVETYTDKICDLNAGPDYKWDECESDEDCQSESYPDATCGNHELTEECGSSRVCEGGDNEGMPCSNDTVCGLEGTCSQFEYDLVRTRLCFDLDDGADYACTWDTWEFKNKYSCLASSFCGNEEIDGTEECDDGNDSNNDSCTNGCLLNVCGDGYEDYGAESCDLGINNGVPCDAPYGGTCQYCTVNCQFQIVSGGYCGDEVINGNELCDADDIDTKYCFSGSTNPNNRDIGISCETDQECTDEHGVGYKCESSFGYCNGGFDEDYDYNGAPCLGSADHFLPLETFECATGECATAMCADNCGSTCPITLESSSVLFEPENQPDQLSDWINLYSYQSGESPDAATLHFPSCRVASGLLANISFESLSDPYLDIVFLLDLSNSMNQDMDGYYQQYDPDGDGVDELNPNYTAPSRLEIATELIAEATEEFFARFEAGKVRIGLSSFYGEPNDGLANASNDHELSNDQESLIDTLNNYAADPDWSTATAQGIKRARNQFEDNDYTKIIILVSDGVPNIDMDDEIKNDQGRQAYQDALNQSQTTKNQEITIFTAAILADNKSGPIGKMAHLSSEDCLHNDVDDPEVDDRDDCSSPTGIPFAYQADTEQEFEDLFDSIIEAIRGVSATFTTERDGEIITGGGLIQEGFGVELPFPEYFECVDGEEDTEVPFRIEFDGIGTIGFEQLQVNYCSQE